MNFFYYSDIDHKRAYLNQFATKLRDIADSDYIASRCLYRQENYRQFLYFSHQCVEKYFKSILLFLEIPAKPVHTLKDLYSLLTSKKAILLSDRSSKFIKELDGLDRASRYDMVPYSAEYSLILDLDYFVREIRPFCQSRYVPKKILAIKPISNFNKITSGHNYKTPKVFSNGLLEKVMANSTGKYKSMRRNLTWKNTYYATPPKEFRAFGFWSINHPLFNKGSEKHKEIFEYISQFIKIEKEVLNHLGVKNKKPKV